jgi:transglutaminase-like putative cysteine protease
MKGYQKLAVFLAVLLFSVGLMSVAIEILGDISDLEFDVDTQLKGASSASSEEGEVGQRKGEKVKVEGAPAGGASPLFEITDPPMARYLRWIIGEKYERGEWQAFEGHQWFPYGGENLELELPEQPPAEYFFTIRPFFNISGFIPGTLHTTRIGGLDNLERYPHLQLFASPEPFSRSYGVTHAAQEHSKVTLRDAEITPNDDYLQVPEEIADKLHGLALEIVEGASSTYEQLEAMEAYLKTTYEYDKEYEPAPNTTDPVEWFLFEERKGVCTQFNSALVLLARTLDIPARTVSGFLVKPDSNYQIVMAKDAHLWAEVSFEDLGWVTFDATPERVEEMPMEIQTYPTVTNITYNDPVALKGDKFQVQGTVTLLNGSAVDGLTVEVFLTLKKNETDAPCGVGIVRDGVFEIACDATPEMAVGDYNLIAHTLPLGVYEESWSDPPIRIMTDTNVTIQAPTSAYVGRRVSISGTLIDASNGQPIANATLAVQVGNETLNLKTDGEGVVSLVHTYEAEGNESIQVIMEDSDYYMGSNSSFGIAVSLPPTPKPGILQILTMYPYNVIMAAGAAMILGSVLLLTRKKAQPTPLTSTIPEIIDEGPLTFGDYKEGVVKLFNRFYARSQRRYEGIVNSMTPREFQAALLGRVHEKGGPALEYLVTAFEIADYSTIIPNQEIYEKCHSAVELLNGLMEYE